MEFTDGFNTYKTGQSAKEEAEKLKKILSSNDFQSYMVIGIY